MKIGDVKCQSLYMESNNSNVFSYDIIGTIFEYEIR